MTVSSEADALDISPCLPSEPALAEEEDTATLAAAITSNAVTNVLAVAVACEIIASVLATAADAEASSGTAADEQEICPIAASGPALAEEDTATLAAAIASNAVTNVLAAAVACEIIASVLTTVIQAELQEQQHQQAAPTKWLPPALRSGAGAATIAGCPYIPPLSLKPKSSVATLPASSKPAGTTPADAPAPYIPPNCRALAARAADGADSNTHWPKLSTAAQLSKRATRPATPAAVPAIRPAISPVTCDIPSSGSQCHLHEQVGALISPVISQGAAVSPTSCPASTQQTRRQAQRSP